MSIGAFLPIADRWRHSSGVDGEAIEDLVFRRLCERRGLVDRGFVEARVGSAGEASVALALAGELPWPATEDEPALLGALHERYRADRRFGGAFFTPAYVAAYIIERGLSDGTVVDPACGGGVFLIAALRALRRQQPRTPASRLLAEHVYGVDLDPGAIVATRRSLLLELGVPLHDAPDLACNLTCADALTTWDGADFSTVVGNPPYHRERDGRGRLEAVASSDWGRRHRRARMDYWYYFLHRGLDALRPGGKLSFIVSAYWTGATGAASVVETLRDTVQVEEIFDLADAPIFDGVSGRHLILTVIKRAAGDPILIKRLPDRHTGTPAPYLRGERPATARLRAPADLFRGGVVALRSGDPVLRCLDTVPPLEAIGTVRQGIAENPATINARTNRRYGERWSVGSGVFVLSGAELAALALDQRQRRIVVPYHALGDIGRWRLAPPSRWLIYATAATWPNLEDAPTLAAHLRRYRPIMEARRETANGRRAWWHLHWPRDASLWGQQKLIALQMAPRPSFAVAERAAYVSFSANVVLLDEVQESLHYVAAVLNSSLLARWFDVHGKRRGVGLDISGSLLRRAPVRRIDFEVPRQRSLHDECADLARRRMNGAAGLDGAIDAAVEALYEV